ncbi:MAG: arsenate reductase family protein [Bacteroidales bacterium]
MNLKIYHNAKCQKSRKGLQYLKDHNTDFEVIDYLKTQPFSESSLKDLLYKLKIKPFELIRTQESEYKRNYKGKDLTDDQWLQILVQNPKLIRRPIIVKGDKAVLGDILEHIDTLL